LVTASTSFANPAITIGRSLSDTFAGIVPRRAGFIEAQLVGALLALQRRGFVWVALTADHLFPGKSYLELPRIAALFVMTLIMPGSRFESLPFPNSFQKHLAHHVPTLERFSA